MLVPGAQAPSAAPGVPVLDFDQVASAEPGSIADRSGTDLAALLYTGGTTGRSKGVPLTHAGLYWCGSAAHEMSVRANVVSSVLPLPLAHAYGLLVICGGMHRTDQAKTILMRWFDPAGWVKLAEEHRVQCSALVPSMIQMLLTQPLEKADLSELTAISSGAAPLAEEVRREFEARVPTATVYEGYGCTEAATFISANPRDARRIGSVGLPVPGVELTIQDDAGQVLPPGQDGEICVRSPGVMTGYWHTEDSSVLAGDWLHTGDIGHLDADGYLYVVDRKKDLILRGGFNVFPRDIEDVLVAHPAVAQAGVVGRPDGGSARKSSRSCRCARARRSAPRSSPSTPRSTWPPTSTRGRSRSCPPCRSPAWASSTARSCGSGSRRAARTGASPAAGSAGSGR